MKAKVTAPFKGVKDGEIQPTEFAEGDTVEGDLARVAVGAGWAEELDDEAPKRRRRAKATDKDE